MSQTITPEQFKLNLRARGLTISAWARANGFKPRQAQLVLSGLLRGAYGEAHLIAVRAGIKADPDAEAGTVPIVNQEPGRRNTSARGEAA